VADFPPQRSSQSFKEPQWMTLMVHSTDRASPFVFTYIAVILAQAENFGIENLRD
jgi:hypothetical protein